MTPDTTHTEAVAAHPDTEPDDLTALVERARVVVWDFDGPICRLFAGHKAEGVARDLVSWLEGRGLHSLLDEAERESLDPHVVLRAVNRRHPGSDLVAELEERLTQEELRASASAMPTAYADVLIHTWDLARAAGLDETLDPAEVRRLYAFMQPMDQMMRQGDANGSVDCASNAPPVKTSGAMGVPILYSPPSACCCRRDAWYVPFISASVIKSQASPALNKAGNTQPASVGAAVPAGIAIW